MIGLIDKICSAISTMEGRAFSNNPGDLRAAPWLPNAKVGSGFWIPDSRAQGIAGMYHQVALDIARGATLRTLISKWAPPSENQTEPYIANVKRWTGIDNENQPLQELLEIQHCGSANPPVVSPA